MDINLHPPLTAFPLALISAALVAELLNFFLKKHALEAFIEVNLLFAVVATIGAFFSGYQAADLAVSSSDEVKSLIAAHHTVGRLLVFVIIPCFSLRYFAKRAKFNRKFFIAGYYLLLITAGALVFYTGYLGGSLVFEHAVGVKAF